MTLRSGTRLNRVTRVGECTQNASPGSTGLFRLWGSDGRIYRRVMSNPTGTLRAHLFATLAPGVLTMFGLFLAFWSLILTTDGRYEAAVWAIFAAALCDTFDGTVARALGVISPLGRQLDSLVDLVAAGVAPALLIYRVYFDDWGLVGIVFGFGWIAAVAIRLARFNTASGSDSVFFVGVPCPIAACVVTQFLLFCRATFGTDGAPWICAALVVGLGAMMLSKVPYWKSTTLMPKLYFHYVYGPATTLVLLGCIPFPHQSLFIGTGVSVPGAAIIHASRRALARRALPSQLKSQPHPQPEQAPS